MPAASLLRLCPKLGSCLRLEKARSGVSQKYINLHKYKISIFRLKCLFRWVIIFSLRTWIRFALNLLLIWLKTLCTLFRTSQFGFNRDVTCSFDINSKQVQIKPFVHYIILCIWTLDTFGWSQLQFEYQLLQTAKKGKASEKKFGNHAS